MFKLKHRWHKLKKKAYKMGVVAEYSKRGIEADKWQAFGDVFKCSRCRALVFVPKNKSLNPVEVEKIK